MNDYKRIALLGLCLTLSLTSAAAGNSSVLSLQSVRDALYLQARGRRVYGNDLDPIGIAELAGFTGWNRNRLDSQVDQCYITQIGTQSTINHMPHHIVSYHISDIARPWTISIACPYVTASAEQGHLSDPSFYARAYGPAILVGSQKPSPLSPVDENGLKYSHTEISFFIKDPGLYTIEVILESIFTPNLYTLPHTSDLVYDGFLIRGFPMIVNVTMNNHICTTAQSCNLTICKSKDIESDLTSSSGRWIVSGHTSRNRTQTNLYGVSDALFQKYIGGSQRLTIETEYRPADHCILAPLHSITTLLDTCMDSAGIHFILIGDSVMSQHAGALRNLLNDRDTVSFVTLNDGILLRYGEVSKSLHEIKNRNSTQPKAIIFNAGLHEIDKMCQQSWKSWRHKNNISDDDIENCAEYYEKSLKQLLELITSIFPSELSTSNAAWMKWGNFGFSWPPQQYQDMVSSPHTVLRFNEIALHVLNQSGYDVKIYDLFWMSWSRPDDTEINDTNSIAKHMVHLGMDTLKVSLRKLITMVADYFECFQK